ncbi:MAG: hypothetical protein ACREA9_21070 [Pyrinomonadaceae bacterium]
MTTAKQAMRERLASSHGIDFTSDFFTLSTDQVLALVDMAKSWGYRKPRNANGSTARYFFAFLAREPKTELQYIVQANYGYGHGWEDATSETDPKEGRARLREYRENANYATRLIKRRVKLEG